MVVLFQYSGGGIPFLLLVIPAVFTAKCDLSLSSIDHLIQRNNTFIHAMNDTLINMTQTADAKLQLVSNFQLMNFLASKGASQGNLLRFVALGGLNLDWINATRSYTIKDSSIGVLGVHILSVYVIPAHEALKEFTAMYSFSYGLFRATTNDFDFYALLDNATTSLDLNNLDGSCVARKRYEINGIGSDLAWTPDYSNASSSGYADLAFTFDTFFEQLFRDKSSAVANDLIRCNVLNAWQCIFTNFMCFKMEMYLATDSDKSADIKKIMMPSNNSFPLKLTAGKTFNMNTGFIWVTPSNPPTTTLSTIASTTTLSTVTTTFMVPSASTASSNSSIFISTGPTSAASSSSSVIPTISASQTTQTTFLATSNPATFSTPISPMASTPINVTNSATVPQSEASASLFLTTLTASSNSSAAGMLTSTETEQSTSNNIINSSQNSNAMSMVSAQSTTASIAYSSSNTGPSTGSTLINAGSSITSNTSNNTFMQILLSTQMSGFSTLNPVSSVGQTQLSNSSTPNPSMLNSTNPFMPNATTSTRANTSNSNSSSQPSYRSTTFDPDPLFLPEVPVFTKLYNDNFLLRMKMGTMTPILDKATFYSVTIPAAAGLAAFVVVCFVLLQIDCLRPPGKN